MARSVNGKWASAGRNYALVKFGTKKERDIALPLIKKKLHDAKVWANGSNALIIDWSG